MEVLKDRARDTYEQLKEAMVTDYQRQVMKLRQRRQDEYAAWLKEIENSKPSRLFGDNAVRGRLETHAIVAVPSSTAKCEAHPTHVHAFSPTCPLF